MRGASLGGGKMRGINVTLLCEALGNLRGWNVRGAMDNWRSRRRCRMFTAQQTDQFMLKYRHPGNSVFNALCTVSYGCFLLLLRSFYLSRVNKDE